MPKTYEPIATYTVTSNQATITFSSIPATYTHLVLQAVMMQNGTATGTNGFLQYNSTTTGYSKTIINGNGSSASSARSTNMSRLFFNIDANASNWVFHTYQIMNYANTNVFKTTLSRQNEAAAIVDASVSLWQNTAAINQIAITASDNLGVGTADQFTAGSTFTLYGIKAA